MAAQAENVSAGTITFTVFTNSCGAVSPAQALAVTITPTGSATSVCGSIAGPPVSVTAGETVFLVASASVGNMQEAYLSASVLFTPSP